MPSQNRPQQKVHQHVIVPQKGFNNQDDARMNQNYTKSVQFEKDHKQDANRSVNDPGKKTLKQDKASEKDKLNSKQQQIREKAEADAAKEFENKHGNTSEFEQGGVESDIKQRQDKNAGDKIRDENLSDETTGDNNNRDQDQEIPENKKEEARESFEKFNRNAMNG